MTTFEYLNEVGIWVTWESGSHSTTLTALFEDLEIVFQIDDVYHSEARSVVAIVYHGGFGVDEIRRGVGQYSDALWFEIFAGIMS
jgi:hypothetical protein